MLVPWRVYNFCILKMVFGPFANYIFASALLQVCEAAFRVPSSIHQLFDVRIAVTAWHINHSQVHIHISHSPGALIPNANKTSTVYILNFCWYFPPKQQQPRQPTAGASSLFSFTSEGRTKAYHHEFHLDGTSWKKKRAKKGRDGHAHKYVYWLCGYMCTIHLFILNSEYVWCPHIVSNPLHGRFDLIEMLHPRWNNMK